jgi:hypothetical protein
MNLYITLGRLELGISTPCNLRYEVYPCKCKALNVGPFFATWLSKTCVCGECKKNTCTCEGKDGKDLQ